MNDKDLIQTSSSTVVFASMCAMCKKVRTADGSWCAPSSLVYENVTHVFCAECADIILAPPEGDQ